MKSVHDIAWAIWEPTDRATLCFVVDGERVLLIEKKRGLGAGKVNGPGGRLEEGETLEECAIRETREEVLITPAELALGGQLQFQFVNGYGIHVWVFSTSEWQGEPGETDEAKPFWTPVDDVPYSRMWEDDRIWLPRLLNGEPFFGRFLFDDDRLIDYELDEDF